MTLNTHNLSNNNNNIYHNRGTRYSFSSTTTQSSSATLTSENILEQNQEELYSGATSETVPTSIVSFHHPHSFQSNSAIAEDFEDSISVTSNNRINNRSRRTTLETNPLLGDNSSIRMPHFRFFSSDQINNAEGSSSMDPADYNLDWNITPEYERERIRQSGVISRRSSIQSNNDNNMIQSPRSSLYGAFKSKDNRKKRNGHKSSRQSMENLSHPQDDLFRSDTHLSDISSKFNDKNRIPYFVENKATQLLNPNNIEDSFLNNENDEDNNLQSSLRSATPDLNDKKRNVLINKYLHCKYYDYFYPDHPSILTYQRFYIAEEDLLIGIASYKTSKVRQMVYNLLCIVSFGLLYLLFRWLPKYRVRFVGKKVPLGKAEWVIVENAFGDFNIIYIKRSWYNRLLSTILPIDLENNENSNNNSVDLNEASLSNPNIPIIISFEYRYINFIFSPVEDIFKTNNNWSDNNWLDIESIKKGLNSDKQEDRQIAFGKNSIDLKVKATSQILFQEVLHPFYVFQIFSIILWSLDQYYYYAGCIFIISVLSIGDSLMETRKTSQRLSKLAHFQCEVRVYRGGFWTNIDASELVPGDIYEISDPKLSILPCDSVLLNGSCIINESILTGESVPVSKIQATSETMSSLIQDLHGTQISNLVAKSFLFNGTKIIRTTIPHGETAALAMVVRTGFSTIKGSLVRSMVFPKPTGFKFYEDSFKYIGYMSLIALLGLSISCIRFIQIGLDKKTMILRALDIVTIVVPPALPATLTIGTSFALTRFKKKKIYCISPTRVNVGGKLDVMCFDKTGTLTEDGLDILGVHTSQFWSNGMCQFGPLLEDAHQIFSKFSLNDCNSKNDLKSRNFLLSLLTCHSLRSINGELLGDPLDFKMFQFSGWHFEEEFHTKKFNSMYNGRHEGNMFPENNEIIPAIIYPNKNDPKNKFIENDPSNFWGIIKTFEFLSDLRCMSVIVKPSNDNQYWAFTKGAPEIMYDICDRSTLPPDYDQLLHHYTHCGYRVIACAGKQLQKNSWLYAQKVKRNEVESNLEFLGFIIFENKLKPATISTLESLHKANLRTIMCTGDNILTAISVGRESGLVRERTVYAPSLNNEMSENEVPIIWSDIDNYENTLDPVTLKPLNMDLDYSLAVSGDIFRMIFSNEEPISERYKNEVLLKASIYARMSPDEKHELMLQLQKLDYTVGFCGDGANDCGALKAADVGVSLSEAEASVAAPFTSQVFDISCVLDVIKEGRASLVTSFACFQYMTLYSAIQFISITILYGRGSNLGDFQFLYIDLFLIVPIAIFMSWSKPFDKIVKKRPSANLVSPKILVPLLVDILIVLLFQAVPWIIVQHKPWYIKPVIGNDDTVQSSDNTVLFFISNFQYILIAIVLSVGPPYREKMSKNIGFIIDIALSVLVSVLLMFLSPESFFGNLLQLTEISFSFKVFIWIWVIFNYYAQSILPKLVKPLFKKKKSSKLYKNLIQEEKSSYII